MNIGGGAAALGGAGTLPSLPGVVGTPPSRGRASPRTVQSPSASA